MIPVNSIAIPDDILSLCADWHDGQDDTLYAVCSSGGLYLGSVRPSYADSDEKWYLQLWRAFSVDIGRAKHAARFYCDPDAEALDRAEQWVDSIVADLEYSYDLEDWDGAGWFVHHTAR